ncbi:MAG: MBOAT family protein [Acidobacteria bacterium]|nr:MBOAT family protein [Acidobacteriota bacterium]MCI0723623.1 MBOAT family protein [Acidobacteriota bacterium]
MVFNSNEFLIFFLIVAPLYFLVPPRFRWILLLAAGLWFYMAWRADYVVLLIMSALLDFYTTNSMGRTDDQRKRRAYLLVSLFGQLGLLFTFKYFNFFSNSLHALFQYYILPYEIPKLNVLLPVGISFYTFVSLGYTIDVYRKRIKPERHLGVFTAFVAYFPALVAGPIQRAEVLLPQLKERHYVDLERIREGFLQALWGFFKKVVVADRLATYVDAVYNNVPDHTGLQYLLATYFFAFQIYCDFSGYTDIAIGCSEILGIDLAKNFDHPYFSKSTVEFWRRWHISLSSWLRDYLYIPLGGNRKGVTRTYVNIAITMLLGGLWHGANWTFVLWGGLQGFLLITSHLKQPYADRPYERLGIPLFIRNMIRVGITFHLACLSWVIFRANNISDASHILRNVFDVRSGYEWATILSPAELIVCFGSLAVFLALDWIDSITPLPQLIASKPLALRWAFQYALLFAIILFGMREAHVFIYFAF